MARMHVRARPTLWMALSALVVAGAGTAGAHEDPSGCFETGPAVIVSVFRANGTTGVIGSVSECETIRYRATLLKASNSDTVCAFSGGTFKLTLPDATVVDVSLAVPCIGGTSGEGCDPTVTSLASALVPYVVSPADVVGGFITASAAYTGGVAHDQSPNTPGVAASTPKSTPVVFCGDTNPCTDDLCDPAGIAAAACSHPPVVCNDNDGCTADTCDPATGLCVYTPDVPCDDQNLCTTDTCDPATGLCVFTPSVPCDDQNLCTGDLCDPATGTCVFTPNVPCTDNDACTADTCNPATGLCVSTPDVVCTDNDLCTADTCDPSSGQCVSTPNVPCPPDANPCTLDPPCDPQTGLCAHPPAPDGTSCPDTDANACTIPACEAGVCVQSALDACPEPIDHVQCYEVKPADFTLRAITAQDQFGTLNLTIRFPHRLCAPADKNAEGILDPTEHLTGYKTKATFTKRLNQTVVNQFGTLQLDVVRPELFMVPTAKDGVPITPPSGDHFTCYKVKRSRGAAKFVARTVTVADQFQNVTETVIKPVRLCAPANKNDEDPSAPLHPDHLLCYKAKSSTPFGTIVKSIDNQFGPDEVTLIHRRELCVPSLTNPANGE